jgi:hypothetical protein
MITSQCDVDDGGHHNSDQSALESDAYGTVEDLALLLPSPNSISSLFRPPRACLLLVKTKGGHVSYRTSRDYYELSMSTTLVVMSSVQYYGLNSTHDNQRCTHQT